MTESKTVVTGSGTAPSDNQSRAIRLGVQLATYEQFERVLIQTGKLRKEGHLLFAGSLVIQTAVLRDRGPMTESKESNNGATLAPESRVESREERKARLREVAKHVSKLTDEQRAQLASRVSVTTIEGRTLSLHNQCLIAYQRPAATIVGGFRQWIKAGRAVLKGEHGSVIWVPIGRKDKETGELEERTGFVLGSVFDVSQTAEIGGAQ